MWSCFGENIYNRPPPNQASAHCSNASDCVVPLSTTSPLRLYFALSLALHFHLRPRSADALNHARLKRDSTLFLYVNETLTARVGSSTLYCRRGCLSVRLLTDRLVQYALVEMRHATSHSADMREQRRLFTFRTRALTVCALARRAHCRALQEKNVLANL